MSISQSTAEKGQRNGSKIRDNGLQILLRALGLCDDSVVDRCNGRAEPLLVAVDFEHIHNFREWLTSDSNFQVGVAILDTRNLKPPYPSPNKIISSWNFVCGSSKYQEKASKEFLFGTPVNVEREAILAKLNSSILGDGERRKIIFVGHSICDDTKALAHLGFNSGKMSICLDTSKVSTEVLPFRGLKLHELLDELQCPYDKLHNGGNDATFILRCLLLIAVKHVRLGGPHQKESMLDYLEAIGTAPYV